MKALVALILLVQLPIHKAVPAAPPAPLGCDDPESVAAAEAAVNYINGHSHHGYKFALNRIEDIRVVPQGPNNDIIFLELDLLETKCHILSPTPLANCTVRSFAEHAVEGDCDVKLQKVDGTLSVVASKCHSHADSSEDILKVCPDCPLLATLNNTEVLGTVSAALNDYNSKTTDSYLRLLEIGRAKIQYHPVHTVVAEFAVGATNCSAGEAKANVGACQLLPEDQSNFGFCTAVMVKRPSEDLQVDCQLYGHQPGVTYAHPGQDTSAGLVPSAVGFTNHNLRLSHNNPVASESSSSEILRSMLSAKSVTKRAVADAAQHDKVPRPVGFVPPPPPCPGKIHHFDI
ncbi:alpha-2-HS-glycoprotein [Corvus cornix cornix]|uniref:alpha-2-HS-glycoprotein n=1 Tax=Corvus brachyrhynchos TaxID=85066 RepID=UPI0004DE0112|nr:PREDICTED: alpha-2-HS-glycoprotein [Corvus brachyrhynchos]XP_010395592.2 alpha-2-HS-glycoprotein [Corvus cornix cornix]XP_048171077.1 alpha-2-HS-glycoprotein [Corvus hawaiiensis]